MFYSGLLGDWTKEAAKIDRLLGGRSPVIGPTTAARVNAFLCSVYQFPPERIGSGVRQNHGPEWVDRAHSIFHEWSERGEDSEGQAELGRIR